MRSSSTSCADTSAIRRILACKAFPHAEPRGISQETQNACRFPALGGARGASVILNKDGSFQRTARFRGPDLDHATQAELVGTTARLNNALRRLGSGWAIFVEASRIAAQRYPQSRFPDPVSNLVDAERRAQFEEAGVHFECVLSDLSLVGAERRGLSCRTLALRGTSPRTAVDAHRLLNGFIDRTDRVLQLVEEFVPESASLSDSETLTYLHSTISTRRHRVRVPEIPMHLDVLRPTNRSRAGSSRGSATHI